VNVNVHESSFARQIAASPARSGTLAPASTFGRAPPIRQAAYSIDARRGVSLALLSCALVGTGCIETRGSSWMAQPLSPDPAFGSGTGTSGPAGKSPARRPPPATAIGGAEAPSPFQLTYYDFPSEADYPGGSSRRTLMTGSCEPIAEVPQSFHDSVCVQGSGKLARGQTVSYAKRDCPCASECPRTGARICFEALDPAQFPWGRGASGKAILPLRTVAADTSLLPMGTMVYISVFDGVPLADGSTHDGCFQVQDRGSKVKGAHLDVFTGNKEGTAAFREVVPKDGVADVVVGSSRCRVPAR
jgi:3D (Asp-Asp-Asp) domain-containing protein